MSDSQYTEQLIALVESAMKYNGISYPGLAVMLTDAGKKPARQSIFKKVKSGTLRANALLKALDMLGIEVKLEKDGKEIPVRSAKGDRIKKTVKGVYYDTKRCMPVADSFFPDGKHKYNSSGQAEELYLEPKSGVYLLVHFCDESIKSQMGRRFPWAEVLTADEAETVKFLYNLT